MKKYFLLALLITPFFISSSFPESFEKEREYRFFIFENEEKCQGHRVHSANFFNCFQFLKFFPDGRAHIILSDMVNNATYEIDKKNNTLLLTSSNPSDMPKWMLFIISPNQRTLVEPSSYKVWELHNNPKPILD